MLDEEFDKLMRRFTLYQTGIKKDDLFDELVSAEIVPSLSFKLKPNRKK